MTDAHRDRGQNTGGGLSLASPRGIEHQQDPSRPLAMDVLGVSPALGA